MSDENSDQNEHHFRRTVSLDPRMTSSTDNDRVTTGSASVHVNPLFEEPDEDPTATDGHRGSSLRRQVSEPARNRHNVIPANVVTRAESIKTMAVRGAQQMLGINTDTNNETNVNVWDQRRRRMIGTYGKLKRTETPIEPNRARLTALSTGFDETDGVLRSNKMTTFTDRDMSPEDTERKPALQVTMKAIALASNALKKKLSNRNATQVSKPDEAMATEMAERGDGSQTLTADSVFYSPSETFDAIHEDFFVKQPLEDVPEAEEEVDYPSHPRRMVSLGTPKRPTAPPPLPPQWRIERQVSLQEKSISEQILQYFDNSNRREFGLGFIDRILGRNVKKNLSKEERNTLNTIDDHIDDFRPYFTYWIITVQILVLIISLSAYGFGYWGWSIETINSLVYVKSLSLQQVDYFEPQNFWGGPRAADLIHLGAKYTPCMRRDRKIYEIIEDERNLENQTGCCIRNDGSGCVQTTINKCSPLLSTFMKWQPGDPNSMGRTSGPVCGQDPLFCEQPASVEPYQWADDITKWPVCRKTSVKTAFAEHMRCELIARPCCLGVSGECHITTREFCDFIKGFFHEEATLCSQVSCMKDVCGMIPFYSEDSPDQFYRIFTPIFLHAGVLHIIITVVFQFFIMKDIEKLTGWVRMATIYLVSGVAGYLASAVFLPFRPEVGPAGSLYGVFAYFFVELYYMWNLLETPVLVLLKQLAAALVLLFLGFLPWIDNYAHVMGFIVGGLLSLALIPTSDITDENKTKKIVLKVVCFSTVVLIIITLFTLLYNVPIYNIVFFKHFNCIPFTTDWCANQDVQVNRIDIL